jgi:NAD+ synthase
VEQQKIITHIVNWLKDYSNKSHTHGFVIGVSGGVDSAVTSTLCAMTGKPVICINMPIHQAEAQLQRSIEHINWLNSNFDNITEKTVDLTNNFENWKTTLPLEIQDDLTMANLRARIRMSTLYAFAGNDGKLVAGTGNKVEDFGVGFYTKYGDGGVDISPIADCTKTDVWELGKELKILEQIINAKPTDGLWDDGRTDESQLGLKYEEVEEAMNNPNSPNYEKYIKIRKLNLHKMEPIPVCKIPK